MSDDPLEYFSGYVSPLTERQHATIGRIAVLWGQIEYFVDLLLVYVSGMSQAELDALGITSRTIAAKVDWLNVAKARHADESYRRELSDFCAIIHETKTSRNHVFHGIWGWRGDDRTKSVFPAARKAASPNQPFRATQLPALERKLCKCSRMGQDLCQPIWGAPVRPRLTKFVHHGAKGGAQEWLKQWSERNRLVDAALDPNAKAGQLLRLSAPLPQK